MKYEKPALTAVGKARALVLGVMQGNGDTSGSAAPTKPPLFALGLDD
jgi:hypothetical protein